MNVSNESSISVASNRLAIFQWHARNTIFVILTIIISIFALASLCLNLLSIKVLLKSGGSVPRNVRLFLINNNVAYVQRILMLNVRWIYHVYILAVGFSRSHNIPWICCMVVEFVYENSFDVVILIMLLLSLERLYVTVTKKKNDDVSALVISSCTLAWLVPSVLFWVHVVFISPPTSRENSSVLYCQWSIIQSINAIDPFLFVDLGIELLTLLIFCCILRQNKKQFSEFNLLSNTHDLAHRHALRTNFQTAKWLIPMSLMMCLCHAVQIVLFVSVTHLFKRHFSYITFLSGLYCVSAIDTFLHPIMFFRYNDYFLRILCQLYPKLKAWLSFRKVNTSCQVISVQVKDPMPSKSVSPSNAEKRKIPNKNQAIVKFHLKPTETADIVDKMWTQAAAMAKRNRIRNGI